jgi:hypothetical protein
MNNYMERIDMGMYGPTEYFTSRYPDWFRETSLSEAILYLFLFFLLMSGVGILIRFFEKRPRLIIDNEEIKIGGEIECGMHCKGICYTLIIRKLTDTEWMAYKLFSSGRKLSLRRGDLKKIVDYLNRNFGYNDVVKGFD